MILEEDIEFLFGASTSVFRDPYHRDWSIEFVRSIKHLYPTESIAGEITSVRYFRNMGFARVYRKERYFCCVAGWQIVVVDDVREVCVGHDVTFGGRGSVDWFSIGRGAVENKL